MKKTKAQLLRYKAFQEYYYAIRYIYLDAYDYFANSCTILMAHRLAQKEFKTKLKQIDKIK